MIEFTASGNKELADRLDNFGSDKVNKKFGDQNIIIKSQSLILSLE